MGRRVIRGMIAGMSAIVIAAIVDGTVVARRLPAASPSRLLLFAAPFVSLLFIVPVFLVSRATTARFSIEDNVLVFAKKRYPLEGVVSVDRDPEILKRAVRLMGNGGLGAIRGRFWSKRVGRFEAFMTGTENAVVVRWPDRVVAVSPADTEFFITCVRSAANLGGSS
jgi:hypothetical protein